MPPGSNAAMDRQTIDLGYVLRQFPSLDFGMGDFAHRLRVQKFVYLLQAFDIYLGYDYTWYLRGPYCTHLATIGYALSRAYDRIPRDQKMAFVNPDVQERFVRFKGFIRGRENDNGFLEIAASLHVLHRTSGMGKDAIIERVAAKRECFSREQCAGIWEEMERWNLMG